MKLNSSIRLPLLFFRPSMRSYFPGPLRLQLIESIYQTAILMGTMGGDADLGSVYGRCLWMTDKKQQRVYMHIH